MTDSTIAFIGLGLIGGSIARGIKREKPDTKIMAYMRTRSRLLSALDEGVIDVILDGVNEQLSECDLIFLCTPVEYNARYLAEIKPFLKPGAIITDVGSTKTDIHEAVTRLGMEDCFIGGHPMAGSEKTGFENSTDHLLENAYYHAGSDLPIELSVTLNGPDAAFTVKDHGKGIDPQLLGTMFEGGTLKRGTGTDAHKGMGIGLSICRTIVAAHNGQISAGNHENGAEFTFILPDWRKDYGA